jgi:hypothetical protein
LISPFGIEVFILSIAEFFLILRWDGGMDSLSATLHRARPDVFPVSTSSPIPSEMPHVVINVCFIPIPSPI